MESMRWVDDDDGDNDDDIVVDDDDGGGGGTNVYGDNDDDDKYCSILLCLQTGWTALHFACANAHSLDQIKQPRYQDTITILLGNGADHTALNNVCMRHWVVFYS